jgi:hypothetical protein
MKNSQLNYKSKYLELRSKYINDLDTAFRLGVEEGMKSAQQQQAMDAQAQTQEAEMAQAQAMGAGQPGEEDGQPGEQSSGEQPGESGQPGMESQPEQGQSQPGMEGQPSELDQHIGKLEGMLGQNTDPEIQKSLNEIKNLRKAEKFALEMKKSEKAIAGIAKALHKPGFKLNALAQHNLSDSAKKSVSMQHKIVSDIMEKWEKEENNASKDITKILNIENLIKE